jgi:hypothetical protein
MIQTNGATGKITESLSLPWRLFGKRTRTPGMLVQLGHQEYAQRSRSQRIRHDTIHFTVRVLLAHQYRFSRVLKTFHTTIRGNNVQEVVWQNDKARHIGQRKDFPAKTGRQKPIKEAEITSHESWLLDLWLDRVAKRGLSGSPQNHPQKSKNYDFTWKHGPGRPQHDRPRKPNLTTSLGTPDDMKKMLKHPKAAQKYSLPILLYAHIDEGRKPTSMYQPKPTGTTH